MFEKFARKVIFDRLGKTLQEGNGRVSLREGGEEVAAFGSGADSAIVEILDLHAYVAFVQGNIASGEAYVNGEWDSPDLPLLLRVLARNLNEYSKNIEKGTRKSLSRFSEFMTWLVRHSRMRTKSNIAAHYDLGNDMFEKFLDDELMYSCAVFPDERSDLTEAQRHKLDLLCRKVGAGKGKRFLDLGCGWGALAIWAARVYGAQVSAVTLSAQQHDFVKERIAKENLEGQVQVHLTDYRDFDSGPGFDCLVSVEMIEAVGAHNFGQYFKRVRNMLKPGGKAVIQAITVPPKRFRDALYDVDFVKKYIFPGGACPSQEMMGELARKVGLVPGKVDEITSHYVTTLEQWRKNFINHINEIKQLGYDHKFCRMMIYYLAYCEAGFAEGELEDVQAEYELPA